jgi:hypothetical protein
MRLSVFLPKRALQQPVRTGRPARGPDENAGGTGSDIYSERRIIRQSFLAFT